MKNYRMLLQYEGTRYLGWQRQESTARTIQGRLEAVLGEMTGSAVQVQGAGRTDAGVHALGQTAHFHAETDKTPDEIRDYLNRYLPEDIAVLSLEEAPERFHSRLCAVGKTYCYRVLNSAVPHIFDRRYVWQVPQPLEIGAMRQAAAYLIGSHDFQSFTSARRGKKSTVRRIDDIRIERAGDEIRLTYDGDGFLYHMVRIMTGTLVEVGLGQRAPRQMPEILEAKSREKAGTLAPGKGLTLVEVRYAQSGKNRKKEWNSDEQGSQKEAALDAGRVYSDHPAPDHTEISL